MEIHSKLRFIRRVKSLFISRKIVFLVLCLIFAIWSLKYFYAKPKMMVFPDQYESYVELQSRLESLVAQEKGTGCAMPDLDPFSSEVMHFITNTPEVSCGDEDWVECHFSECSVKRSILERIRDIKCTYKDLIYVDDDNYIYGNPVVVKGDASYPLNASDFVKISCTGHVIGGLDMLTSHWHGLAAGFRPLPASPSSGLNVLMIIIDSTSRNNFLRQMPTSYQTLKSLKAVILEAYNIVGQASAGAIIPILSGYNDLEIPDYRRRPNNTRRIDPKHFLFAQLKEKGYRTAFFEDTASIHTFNYRYNGFEYEPADHYGRPLFLEKYLSRGLAGWITASGQCLGSELILRFMLNHSEKFFKLNGKKFGFMFNIAATHDNDNSLAWFDHDLAAFLMKFQMDGHFNDTLLFVMGDHGQRFSRIRKTYQGKIEERLPFVSVILPENLKKVRPDAYQNLMGNAKVLTTPYDVHSTILDVLELYHLRNKYKVPGADIERGLSLLDAIPTSRSCAEAGVMPHWCACANWNNVSSSDPAFKRVATEIANYIDRKTEPVRNLCAKRELLSILWMNSKGFKSEMLGFEAVDEIDAYIGKYSESKHVISNIKYYQAKIVMTPAEAVFEGSIQYDTRRHEYIVSDGDVSRVNRYGDESNCIKYTHPHLCQFCYCKGTELKKKWTNIRDYYRKEVQRNKSIPTGSAAKKSKTYVYSELLYFLTPIFSKRDSDSNYPKELQYNQNQEQTIDPETQKDILNPIESPSPSPSPPPATNTPVVNQKKMKDVPSQILNILQQRQKAIAKTCNTEEDDDTNFLLSFRSYMKKMNPQQKIDFQLGMLQLVKKITMGNELPSYNNNLSESLSSPHSGRSYTPVTQSSNCNSSPSPTYIPAMQRNTYVPQNSPIYLKSPSPSPSESLYHSSSQQPVTRASTSKPKIVIHSISNVAPPNSTIQQNAMHDYPELSVSETAVEDNQASQFLILQSEDSQKENIKKYLTFKYSK